MNDDFDAVAVRLRSAKISVCEFEVSIKKASKGDLVYADPPYTVKHNKNGFVKYNECIFSWDDQVRLAGALQEAASRGAIVIASNADHPSIHELYKDVGEISALTRASVIAGAKSARGSVGEVLIRCF